MTQGQEKEETCMRWKRYNFLGKRSFSSDNPNDKNQGEREKLKDNNNLI